MIIGLGSFARALIVTAFSIAAASDEMSAQSTPTREQRERIDELLRDSYRPARSREQMLDCHYRALTRELELSDQQERVLRIAIDEFRKQPEPRPGSREFARRFAVRDSVALLVLTTSADSAQYRRNSATEERWFQARNCNG
jgi:hypothetical protein